MRAVDEKPVRRYLWRYEVRRSRCLLASEASPASYDDAAIFNPGLVAAAFRGIVGDAPREHFLAFYLDVRNRVMGFETIAIGGVSSVQVEVAEVFRGALVAGATQIVVAHNHPSGDAVPSALDVDLTKALVKAGELIGVAVLDHVIVTTSTCYSFASAGRLQ